MTKKEKIQKNIKIGTEITYNNNSIVVCDFGDEYLIGVDNKNEFFIVKYDNFFDNKYTPYTTIK